MRISDWSSDVCSSDLEPDAEGVAGKVLRRFDAAVLAAGQHHARLLEHLGDVHPRHAFLARRQGRGHPVDDDVGAAAGYDLRLGAFGTARPAGGVGSESSSEEVRHDVLLLVGAVYLKPTT